MRHRAFGRWSSRLADDRGQTIVMFAISMIAMLAFIAVVVDVAVIFEERRQLQNAADGAALAAARELPGSPSAAVTAAETYLAANGYSVADADVSFAIDTSYLGDPEDVEVIVTQLNVPYLFGRVVGLTTSDVSARAVAEIVTSADDEYAIFAIDNSCGATGVEISGSLASFHGTVHSNANVTVAGTSHAFDPAITYQCNFTEGGSGHTYQREEKSTGARPIPSIVAGITFASFLPCDFSYSNNVNLKSKNEVWQNPQKTILRDGVYCFGRNVTLIGDDIVGNGDLCCTGAHRRLGQRPRPDRVPHQQHPLLFGVEHRRRSDRYRGRGRDLDRADLRTVRRRVDQRPEQPKLRRQRDRAERRHLGQRDVDHREQPRDERQPRRSDHRVGSSTLDGASRLAAELLAAGLLAAGLHRRLPGFSSPRLLARRVLEGRRRGATGGHHLDLGVLGHRIGVMAVPPVRVAFREQDRGGAVEDDAGEDGPGDDQQQVVGDRERGVFEDEEGEED